MNVDEMLHGVRDALRAQTVYGEAVERDGLTVIPAATFAAVAVAAATTSTTAAAGSGSRRGLRARS